MYCAKCGNQLKEGEVFCPKCGAKVGAKSMKVATLLGIIFALVVIIGLMALNFRSISKKINSIIETETETVAEVVESSEDIITETETTAETTTVVATQIQTQATTKAQIVQTQVQTQAQTQIQTTQPYAVSFTPPIYGTVAAETQAVQQAVVETETSKRKGAADGGPVTEDAVSAGPGAYIAPTSAKSVVTDPEVVGSTSQEVKVKTTTKYTDSIEDDDDHTCKITVVIPTMQGKDQEETDALNSSLEELMDALIEDVESIVDDYDDLPKSISLTSATVTSTTRTNIFITISGSITPRSGSSKTLKYRITYDREEQIAEYNRI